MKHTVAFLTIVIVCTPLIFDAFKPLQKSQIQIGFFFKCAFVYQFYSKHRIETT